MAGQETIPAWTGTVCVAVVGALLGHGVILIGLAAVALACTLAAAIIQIRTPPARPQ